MSSYYSTIYFLSIALLVLPSLLVCTQSGRSNSCDVSSDFGLVFIDLKNLFNFFPSIRYPGLINPLKPHNTFLYKISSCLFLSLPERGNSSLINYSPRISLSRERYFERKTEFSDISFRLDHFISLFSYSRPTIESITPQWSCGLMLFL